MAFCAVDVEGAVVHHEAEAQPRLQLLVVALRESLSALAVYHSDYVYQGELSELGRTFFGSPRQVAAVYLEVFTQTTVRVLVALYQVFTTLSYVFILLYHTLLILST